jgi:hypothetical protein
MEKFLACDWGTTTFRLRLVDANTCTVIAEEKNQKGISDTYSLWKQMQIPALKCDRLFIYRSLTEAIKELKKNWLSHLTIFRLLFQEWLLQVLDDRTALCDASVFYGWIWSCCAYIIRCYRF